MCTDMYGAATVLVQAALRIGGLDGPGRRVTQHWLFGDGRIEPSGMSLFTGLQQP